MPTVKTVRDMISDVHDKAKLFDLYVNDHSFKMTITPDSNKKPLKYRASEKPDPHVNYPYLSESIKHFKSNKLEKR